MRNPIYVRTLRRAAEILGGELALANYLNVPLRQVQMWQEDVAPVPNDVFLTLVDLLLERDISSLRDQISVARRSPRA